MAIEMQGSTELNSRCLVEERITAETTQGWLLRDTGVAYHDSICALLWKMTMENR